MSIVATNVREVCAPKVQTMCFSVFAHAEPFVLPKLCLPISKRGIMISRLHASVIETSEGKELQLDFQVQDMDQKLANQIAQTMRQFPDVTCVLVSEKG